VLEKPVVSGCDVVSETFGGYPCGIITENNQKALEDGIKQMLVDPILFNQCCNSAAIRSSQLGLDEALSAIEVVIGEGAV
jgi:hypothetical protein